MKYRRFAAVLVLTILGGCVNATEEAHRFGFVGVRALEVRQACVGVANCFDTISGALHAAASLPETEAVVIQIGPGNFKERVVVQRENTTLVGAGRERTRIFNDLVAETAGHFHRNGWGTPGSATLAIDADRVTLRDLTVENTFDYLANDALPADDPAKISNSQAAAVLLDIHSDRILMDDVALLGYQDTLFANGGRAYVRNSLIAGNVDFIFGNGKLLIEDSELRTRRRGSEERDGAFSSFLLAPSTPISQQIGIIVYRSKLTREEGVADESVALARPWHPTTRFADGRYADPNAVGQAIFIECYMGPHINRAHWASMPGTARDGTKTAIFTPQSSRFWEINSIGPGARHDDIGLRWKPDQSLDAIRRLFFEGWDVQIRPPK